MSDLFHELITSDYINCIFDVMRRRGQHTFQILTKRAARMLKGTVMMILAGPQHSVPPTAGAEAYRAISRRRSQRARVESYGTRKGSMIRCLALTREQCPNGESNYYVADQ